jgi:hypothetical protein
MLSKIRPPNESATFRYISHVTNLSKASYIFLDIDGVLNTYHYRARQKELTGQSSPKNWCPSACANIVRLVELHGAGVVVSSNWKDLYKLPELRDLFANNGIPASYIIDLTPSEVPVHAGAGFRGIEIQRWLDDHSVNGSPYLIIDDDSTVLPSHMSHLVQVNPEDGFANPEAFAKARKILGNGMIVNP